MRESKIGLSVRYKLLCLLIVLPLVSLGLYVLWATDSFKRDKIAYVFGSSAAVSRSLAMQARMEAQNSISILHAVVEGFDFTAGDFSQASKDGFAKNARLHDVLLFRKDNLGEFIKLGQLVKDASPAQKFAQDEVAQKSLREQAAANTVILAEESGLPGALRLAFRLGEKDDPNQMIVVGLIQADDFLGAFEGTTLSSFVLSREGGVVVGALEAVADDVKLLRDVVKTTGIDGTAEMKLADGVIYLVSYSPVGLGDLVVISKVAKDQALQAVYALVFQSICFFGALLGITLLISVFASKKLTSALGELFEATTKIAQGDFNVRVEPRSNDEVGGLAESFNWMVGEVARLMENTAEKVRMEGELATVRTVQETLFPAASSQFGPLRINGHFEPASECGGDWWSYSRIGNRIFIYVGDATGHGAPAALITSAATSAAAVIETMPEVTPGKAMTILNKAIHQTSKGSIMMTFFVCSIDLDTNVFSYASASHDPPYLLRNTGEKLGRKDLVPLNEVNGPRLGDRKDFIYEETSFPISPGDQLFFYTDGILDIQDMEGKKWGERTFLKTLLESANSGESVEGKVEAIRGTINKFRGGSALIDDVTMVMCEFGKAA